MLRLCGVGMGMLTYDVVFWGMWEGEEWKNGWTRYEEPCTVFVENYEVGKWEKLKQMSEALAWIIETIIYRLTADSSEKSRTALF